MDDRLRYARAMANMPVAGGRMVHGEIRHPVAVVIRRNRQRGRPAPAPSGRRAGARRPEFPIARRRLIHGEIRAPVGVACASPAECAGNLCLTDAAWTGGYCSQGDCDPFSTTSCSAFGQDAVCGVLDLFGAVRIVCLDGCSNSGDCRPGYQCQWVGIGGNGCVPQ